MLTNDKDVTDGLTNGAIGIVTDVVLARKNTNIQPTIRTIRLKFDSTKAGQSAIVNIKYKHINDSSVPITRMQVHFLVHGEPSFQASHMRFLLFLAWVITGHECEGITVQDIIVDMAPSKGTYQSGQAYVTESHNNIREIVYCYKTANQNLLSVKWKDCLEILFMTHTS